MSENIKPSLKFRRSTNYTLTFPTAPSLTRVPTKVELHQKQHNHDVLVLRFPVTSERWINTLTTGLPVKFEWVQDNQRGTFIGEVASISKTVGSKIQTDMEVHCVAATYKMKQRDTRVFSNKTIPEAISIIAQEYGFKLIGEYHERVFPQLTMAGHSYWEWIHEQAKRIGFGIAVDGVIMSLRPLDQMVEHHMASSPILTFINTQIPTNGMVLDRTLDSLKVTKSDNPEGHGMRRANKIVGGVNPLTGTVSSSTASPKSVGSNFRADVSDVLFDEYVDQIVHDNVSATTMAEGAAQTSRLTVPAKIKAQGDPRMRPFAPIYVQGTGASTDGFWVIKEIIHMFTNNGLYQVEIDAVSDGTGVLQKTATRPDTASVVGVVNLNEALKGNRVKVNSANHAVLAYKKPVINETKQGFNLTPNSWKYSSKAPRG